jgi:hypothetical protein
MFRDIAAMHGMDPGTYYEGRKKEQVAALDLLRKKSSALGWGRLAVILAGAFLLWFNRTNGALAVIALALGTIAVFLFLVNRDVNLRQEIRYREQLLALLEKEFSYLGHRYADMPDGSAFADPSHPYAEDLDIFGRASLYQYINRTASEQGSTLLASWLKHPATAQEIAARQSAVRSLGMMPDWMIAFRVRAGTSSISIGTEKTIREWLAEKNSYTGKPLWQVLRFIMPALALTLLGFYIADRISYPQFLLGLFFFVVLAYSITHRVSPLYRKLNNIAPQISTLAGAISHIEGATFTDPLLRQMQQELRQDGTRASAAIRSLNEILARFDYRLNPLVFIPLNIFFLWDLQQVLQLEQWKERNNREVRHWFGALEQFEALTSLGTLCFNHPSWVFPVTAAEPCLIANGLGHPLILPDRIVRNDFATSGFAQVNIITGSNMAGKSTFLRSVGVNMVLGSMGAPVNASSMTFSPIPVMSSMRIKDNLEESTSTFYAELKKLKAIIDRVQRREPVFILLDEVLRGTNSADRHTGSKALVRQLLADQAMAIVATHDLELATLASDLPGIHNYHFDVQVQGEELFFDYKLRPGICTSLNASILMKKIGIRL